MTHTSPKLAIAGGPKAKKRPYGTGRRYGKPELKLLAEAVESDSLFWLHGKKVARMCETFAKLIRVKHCTAVSSGTAAVHVALGAIGIRPGDEVITSPITDFGSVVGILYQNAIPIFADVDPHTYNMDPKSIEANITRKTRVILVVHLAGNPADMNAITKIARRHKLAVVEDCAQAYLTGYRGRFVGTLGRIGCFSLNNSKHISTGDGGMVVTNDDDLAERMEGFADKFYWRIKGRRIEGLPHIPQLAPNYHMTELQAAVAIAQIRKLKRICRRHHEIGDAYTKGLTGIPGIHPHEVVPGGHSTWWFYMFRRVARRIPPGARRRRRPDPCRLHPGPRLPVEGPEEPHDLPGLEVSLRLQARTQGHLLPGRALPRDRAHPGHRRPPRRQPVIHRRRRPRHRQSRPQGRRPLPGKAGNQPVGADPCVCPFF